MKPITHQFTLFDYNSMRHKTKVPISRERIEAAKKAFNSGDYTTSASHLRDIRESLERYEQRINSRNNG
jgi:hypothetical protein